MKFKTSVELMVSLFPDAILEALQEEGADEERCLTKEEFDKYYTTPDLYKNALTEYGPEDENGNQYTFLFCADRENDTFYVLTSGHSSKDGLPKYFITVFNSIERIFKVIKKAYIAEAAMIITDFCNKEDDVNVFTYIHALTLHSLAVEYNVEDISMEDDDAYKIMYSEDDGLLYIFIKVDNVSDHKNYYYITSLAEACFILQDTRYFLFGYND